MVPTIDLKKKLFPILKIAKMNNGKLITSIIKVFRLIFIVAIPAIPPDDN